MRNKGYTIVGQNFPRIDAIAKVTGEARYTCDLKFTGMLWGRFFEALIPMQRS